MAGTAGAAALKKVRSLASAAPTGRAFAAIATLDRNVPDGRRPSRAGTEALERGDVAEAETEWAHAVVVMDEMASEAPRPPDG